MKFWLLLVIATLAVSLRLGADVPKMFDVKAFGAVGDGKTLDHAAIDRAIAAAHDAGGGTVHLPAGTYLCFSVHLQSNVALQFEPGATLLAAEGEKYDPPEPDAPQVYQDFGHSHFHNSLIWGENLENVSIVGPGLIHGRGLSRGSTGAAPLPEQTVTPATPPGKFGYPHAKDTLRAGIGNKSIALKNCRNVILRDFSILHGGHFGILATGIDNLSIDNLKIDTERDGMDIDSCRNVRITDCSVNAPWDDAICLKSDYALGEARACEDVTITGCYVSGDYQEGTMLDGTWKHFSPTEVLDHTGRIKFGTESNGGFKRIAITNCAFDHCRGLAIETVDGGVVEDVVVNNLTMRDVVASPIFIRLGSRLRGPDGTPMGAIRRVVISNVTVSGSDGRYPSILSGIPDHPLEDVQITNMRALQGGGGTEKDAALQPAEKENSYPEPTMFGTIPAWGFYVRHCAGLEMRSVGLKTDSADQRACIVLDEVTDASFDGLKTPPRAREKSLFRLRDVKNFDAYRCAGIADIHRDAVSNEDL